MRNVLLLLVAAVASASCASSADTRAEPAAPAPSGVVIQIHHVADVVAARGAQGGIEELASEARREVASAPSGAGTDVSVTVRDATLVVVAPPEAQARVMALLLKARAEAAPEAQ
jgi:hypothetical protein